MKQVSKNLFPFERCLLLTSEPDFIDLMANPVLWCVKLHLEHSFQELALSRAKRRSR